MRIGSGQVDLAGADGEWFLTAAAADPGLPPGIRTGFATMPRLT